MDRSDNRAEADKDYASLVVKVANRQALPVRAIPYVTGWTISPVVVAKNFARSATAGFEILEQTDTYHLIDGRVVKLLPKEWDRYVAALQGCEAELKEKYPKHEIGYAAWISQSVAKLPGAVFVWLDEFVADFNLDFGPDRLSLTRERAGDRELNMSPFLDNKTLNMVLEGFELRTPLRTYSSDDPIASLVEFVYNGRPIDWGYWVQDMPTLSPGEACRLMSGLDPELFEDLTSRPVPENDPSKACAEARKMERLALTERRERQAPDAWYRWALERDYCVHRGFFIAALGRHLRENEALVLGNMPRPEAVRWERAHVAGDGQREVSSKYAGLISTVVMTFQDFVAEVDERLARWRRGRYVLVEAAQVMADSSGLNAEQLAEQMESAIHAGKLAYRVNNIRVDQQRIPQERLWGRTVFQGDVNAWLEAEANGHELKLEYPYSEAATFATSEPGNLLLEGLTANEPSQQGNGPDRRESAHGQQGNGIQPKKSRPRVAWRLFIETHLDACIDAQETGGPRGLIKFICDHGSNYRVFANPSDLDSIIYKTELNDSKPVKKKTIQTAIADLKRARNKLTS